MARAGRLDRLAVANIALLVAVGVHAGWHVTRGLHASTPEVLGGGAVLAAMVAASLPLTLTRHPAAPFAAVAVGLLDAAAVSASHFAPHWSALSDSFSDNSVGAFGWASAAAEVGAALVFALAGAAALRRVQPSPATVEG
jgi:predicted ABC-type sugar transport system permease subunit